MAAKKPKAETKALSVPERAIVALGYDTELIERTRVDLRDLAARSAHITEITNVAGYQQVHGARMALKNARLEIAKRGKSAREDAQAFSKAVIAEERALVALIEPEETRLDLLQSQHDERVEAEKQAAIAAEARRVASIQARIADIRGAVQGCVRIYDPAQLERHIGDIERIAIDETFAEFQQVASDAKVATLITLTDYLNAARERVQADELARKDREELARLRAEAERRGREDRERVAAEERKAEAARAEIARVEAIVPCAGRNCGATDYTKHSPECIAEHERVTATCSIWKEPEFKEPAPTVVENLGAGLITHLGSQPPSFEEIVRVVAWHFETDESTVRHWIIPRVSDAAKAA